MKKKIMILFSILLSILLIWLAIYMVFVLNKDKINVATSLASKQLNSRRFWFCNIVRYDTFWKR